MTRLGGVAAVAALVVACAAPAMAQTEKVWASFVFVLHGERTPHMSYSDQALTPIGAIQIANQGRAFRARYLTASKGLSDSEDDITTRASIVGISEDALDNTQLAVFTNQDQFNTAGATAFLQALYPPANLTYAESAGGAQAAVLVNSDQLFNYPLGGYQYPNIRSMSVQDPGALWLQGNVACTNWVRSSIDAVNEALQVTAFESSVNFYSTIHSRVFAGKVPSSAFSYSNAYEAWEFADYQFRHNSTVRNLLTVAELDELQDLARAYIFARNANLTATVSSDDNHIRPIAGKALADMVVARLQDNIASGDGSRSKLTLVFGSYHPFVAWFALSDLASSPLTGGFKEIPQPGSAMMWELFSRTDDTLTGNPPYPSTQDLYVRFLYRNGTSLTTPFQEYPLFGRGLSQSQMRWGEFGSLMGQVGVGSEGNWCRACDSPLQFCEQELGGDSSGRGGGGRNAGGSLGPLTPTVAGVVGAMVTLAVTGIVAGALFALGCLRVTRRRRGEGDEDAEGGRSARFGGFKGREKMASDADLAVSCRGQGHERVGSWELGKGGPSDGLGSVQAGPKLDLPMGASGIRGFDDDDRISIMDHKPVKPTESL